MLYYANPPPMFMASREELSIIRAARSGQGDAQIALGKKYLFGGTGLPKSLPTALYWLDRAAQQNVAEAWSLIGRHVPSEVVLGAGLAQRVLPWYERAFDAGDVDAGFELARLVLALPAQAVAPRLRCKALSALEQAARADGSAAHTASAGSTRGAGGAGTFNAGIGLALREGGMQPLHRCAGADPAEIEAQLERSAMAGDGQARLSLGLWLARIDRDGMRVSCVAGAEQGAVKGVEQGTGKEVGQGAVPEAGQAVAPGIAQGAAQYKRAIRWLLLAAGQGLSEAAYALSKIYLKSEFSQRSVPDARVHLERAALAGHALAQHEMGISAWRQRRRDPVADIRAAYWLQQAAAKGVRAAADLLEKIAPPPAPALWAQSLLAGLPRTASERYPALVARIELAAIFGLSRAEALLLDLRTADCDHCLLVDIRAGHQHSRRRLISMQTLQQRHALLRITHRLDECGDVRADSDMFGHRPRLSTPADALLNGQRSNYRQRLYRLKRLQASSTASSAATSIARAASLAC